MKKTRKLLSILLAFVMMFTFANISDAAKVDSDMSEFYVLIAREQEINLASAIEGGRIVFSSKLGTDDIFGPSVISRTLYKNKGVTSLEFTITEGKTELESLGYTVSGEIVGQTGIDEIPEEPGPQVTGISKKPGIVDFTGTVVYDKGGKMILPMKIKVLPKFFITKDFKMPEGVTKSPKIDFDFEFVSPEGVTGQPTLDDVKISYAANEKGIKTSADLTEIVKNKFTATGEYRYILKEKATTHQLVDNAEYKEALTQSKAEYEVVFVVESNPQSAGYRVLEVKVKSLKDDAGTATNGEKIDNYYKEGEDNGIRFNNKYNKTLKSDSKKPLEKGLHINKTVTGNIGDKNMYFPFKATLTKPEVLTEENETATNAKAYIWDNRTRKKVVDVTANGINNATEDGSFEIAYGTEFTFNLKHGQSVIFENAIVGSKLVASETDAKSHESTVASVSGGGTPTNTGEILVSDAGLNNISVTNHKETTSAPTGVFLENGSFVMIIAMTSIAIFALLIANKRRKNRI